ncbi:MULTISPECIES: ead/Ea22-like family protein [Enterobacter cloacae complex]|uniref:Ead/Ea22-like family protein n=1 Tax=Enterobacter cloacae TaxID=550 RepID=A0AA42R1C0_ENTCL|nr:MULTISPECIES: ead/Ea22-like family protein [Enterobacter cloacae complex]MDH0439431.1 ead/Ea22-like family protein [Enterobacter cloacae]MDH1481559.1 ead/Ea22-like family protein [Enterobacter cloacae]UXL10421.1 ead/Ea22-like family protein [Enterobacter cloacae]HDS3502639.1 ead/Ea22-like family protein [Enterobacter cloacae]
MSNIDKRALREAAERAGQNDWEYVYTSDLSAPGRGYITVGGAEAIYCLNKAAGGVKQSENVLRYIAAANPATVLALLDELESAEERYVDILRQARSFREAHDAASEIIRKLERNKPTVKLPTTRLWAGKIACYEESEVVAMLERAGINIDAAGKGEAS